MRVISLFRARIARPSDRDLVAHLCRRAVGSHDYAIDILKHLIAGRGLFLAFDGDELVGMTNFERCIDGAGWLGVARTDPDWRGRGVAGFLVDQVGAYARPRGIRTLRLWTSPKNKPAIKSAFKNKFRSVCEAVHVSRRVGGRQRRDTAILPAKAVPKTTMRSILASSYLSRLNGYFPHDWHFVRATPQVIKATAARRELYVLDGISFVLTKPERWEEFNGTYASFALLGGPPTVSLRSVQNVAKSKGIKYIGAYLPHDRYLISTARRLGYRVDSWGRHCIVFEKAVG